jgi:hypothetical protein
MLGHAHLPPEADVTARTTAPRRDVPATAAIVLAAVLHLIVLVPFTVASGLLAPLWAVGILYVVWAGFAALLVVVARRRPFLTMLVPVANAAVLWLVITLGEQALGWTG